MLQLFLWIPFYCKVYHEIAGDYYEKQDKNTYFFDSGHRDEPREDWEPGISQFRKKEATGFHKGQKNAVQKTCAIYD
jgi:hypothetical protein